MVKLAIKGHKTRGKEVIEIFEMLGGKNNLGLFAKNETLGYFIKNGVIYNTCMNLQTLPFKTFTLEEFLEKYPYKVGDKVIYNYNKKTYFIRKMYWEKDNILYQLSDETYTDSSSMPDVLIFNVDATKLQPYKEETMETITIDDFKANTKEWLIDKLESMSKDNALQTINNIYDELHKPKYPKTYEECCEVLGIGSYFEPEIRNATTEECHIFMKLMRLKRCRNAYWKIAGEEMELGKPWKPDWTNTNSNKHCIYFVGDEIKKQPMLEVHHFLAFPTAEIRDAYKENFDNDIEICKEFL